MMQKAPGWRNAADATDTTTGVMLFAEHVGLAERKI